MEALGCSPPLKYCAPPPSCMSGRIFPAAASPTWTPICLSCYVRWASFYLRTQYPSKERLTKGPDLTDDMKQ